MLKHQQILALSGAFASAVIIAACGGGGGGGGTLPQPSPSPSVAASPSTGLTGSMQIATGGTVGAFTYTPANNATVVFSCGCSSQAGIATADGSGTYNIVAVSTATPSAPPPNQNYTVVATRNYVVVGTTSNGEAWNLQFAGSIPSHDLLLTGSNPSDVYSAAATLYVYRNSPPGITAFDAWNFNAVLAWITTLKTTPSAKETTFLNHIASESALHHTLFPAAPPWNPGQASNGIIAADLTAVTGDATDSTKPTPCPGGVGTCTGTPAP